MPKTHFSRADNNAYAESLYQYGEPIGNIFYVSSVTGSSVGPGYTPEGAYATIAQAMAVCQANNNDVIRVMPGHVQTITAAAGLACSVAGVTIEGVGNGTERPTFTFTTSVNADLNVSAVNVRIRNLRFVSGVDSLVNFLDIDEGNFTVEDCEFVTSSTFEALTFADIATGKDEIRFVRCRFVQPTDPAGTDGNAGTGCIYFEDTEGVYVLDCEFAGAFETAILHNKTTAAKRVWVRNCFGFQLLTGAEVFTQVANLEGGVQSSAFIIPGADDVTEAKTWGTLSDKFFVFDSYVGNDGAGGQLAVAGASAAT